LLLEFIKFKIGAKIGGSHVLNFFTHEKSKRRGKQGNLPITNTSPRVGVTLCHLTATNNVTGHLPNLEPSRPALDQAIDRLNQCFGKNTVYFGGAQAALDSAPARIAFTHVPAPEKERSPIVPGVMATRTLRNCYASAAATNNRMKIDSSLPEGFVYPVGYQPTSPRILDLGILEGFKPFEWPFVITCCNGKPGVDPNAPVAVARLRHGRCPNLSSAIWYFELGGMPDEAMQATYSCEDIRRGKTREQGWV
jgi:hypothetical protein